MPLMHFVIFALLSCPPNFLWQEFLEEKFPGYVIEADGQRLNKLNTAKKFVLDQTIGAAVNTILFVAAMGTFKGKDGTTITRECRRVRTRCQKHLRDWLILAECLAAHGVWLEAVATCVAPQLHRCTRSQKSCGWQPCRFVLGYIPKSFCRQLTTAEVYL